MARVYKKLVGLCRRDWTGGDGQVYRTYSVTYVSRTSTLDGIEGVRFDRSITDAAGNRRNFRQCRGGRRR